MITLDEMEIKELLDSAYALKRKDKIAFGKILYLMKGIEMGQELGDKVVPK